MLSLLLMNQSFFVQSLISLTLPLFFISTLFSLSTIFFFCLKITNLATIHITKVEIITMDTRTTTIPSEYRKSLNILFRLFAFTFRCIRWNSRKSFTHARITKCCFFSLQKLLRRHASNSRWVLERDPHRPAWLGRWTYSRYCDRRAWHVEPKRAQGGRQIS